MACKAKTFNIGDRVRLTGAFLRSTGQIVGGEGQKRWTVMGIKAVSPDFVIVRVDEDASDTEIYYTREELEAMPELRQRGINAANLQKCR